MVQPLPGHQHLQGRVVVVQGGQPCPIAHGEDQVVIAGVGDVRGIPRVEVLAAPAQRGQRRLQLPGLGWAGARGDAGQRRGQPGRAGAGPDGHRAGQGVEVQQPRAVAFGDRDRSRDRSVTAEGHLRPGAEVPDPVLPGPARFGERGLGIADPGSHRQARGLIQACSVQHHPGGVAAPAMVGERRIAQHSGTPSRPGAGVVPPISFISTSTGHLGASDPSVPSMIHAGSRR